MAKRNRVHLFHHLHEDRAAALKDTYCWFSHIRSVLGSRDLSGLVTVMLSGFDPSIDILLHRVASIYTQLVLHSCPTARIRFVKLDGALPIHQSTQRPAVLAPSSTDTRSNLASTPHRTPTSSGSNTNSSRLSPSDRPPGAALAIARFP